MPLRPSPVVTLDDHALAAHGFSPRDLTHAPPGAVLVAGDGTALRVTPEGALDPWPPRGRKSIASDPSARRPQVDSLQPHRKEVHT